MDLKNLHESKTVKTALITIGATVAILVLLSVGMNIGTRRAGFAGEFGQNYERNFMGQRGGSMMGGFFDGRMPGGHGVVGEIISLNLPELVISGPDNLEKTVLVGTSTTIRKFQNNIESSELKSGDFVVVIGNPNDKGQIDAKLIRIMPSPYEKQN